MLNLTITNKGLDEIKEFINPERINKELAVGVGLAVIQLHNVLKHEVFARYNAPNNLDKALVRKDSIAATGRGFITSGLQYKDTLTDLSRYPYSPAYSARKKGKGQVYETTVVRGQTKVVRGKRRYGGFVAPRRGATIEGGPSFALFMYERLQKKTWMSKGVRAPFQIVQTLGLADMANIMLLFNANVKREIDNLPQKILDNLK